MGCSPHEQGSSWFCQPPSNPSAARLLHPPRTKLAPSLPHVGVPVFSPFPFLNDPLARDHVRNPHGALNSVIQVWACFSHRVAAPDRATTSLAWGEHPIDSSQPTAYDELLRQKQACQSRMSLLICKCCGEPIAEKGNTLSRNPNICASCSSMSDGMPESNMSSFPDSDDSMLVALDSHPVTAEPATAFARS